MLDRFKRRRATAADEGARALNPSGFHGDLHLQRLQDGLLKQADAWIETGTNVGSTLRWVAERNPDLPCWSCEPNPDAAAQARGHVAQLPNAHVETLGATDFLALLPSVASDALSAKSVWWLDAHGHGFTWPLREEVAFATSQASAAYIFIDDFQVPGVPEFGFDAYDQQVCNWEFIADAVHDVDAVQLWYPSYTDLTSDFHPLRGWGLIVVDPDGRFEVPEALKQYGRRAI